MNSHYSTFIELGKTLANDKKLLWDIPLDQYGLAEDGVGWNLTACVGDVPPPIHYLRSLGLDEKAHEYVNAERTQSGLPQIERRPLSAAWQDLIKAAVCVHLLFRRNTPSYVVQSLLRPLKVIATCVDKEPWELTLDDLRRAVIAGKSIQASGKLGDLVIGVVKIVFDANRICDAGQLFQLIGIARVSVKSVKSKHAMSSDELRTTRSGRLMSANAVNVYRNAERSGNLCASS